MRLICGLVYLDGTPATSQALNAMIAALGAPGLVPAVSQRIEDAAGLAVLDFSAKTAPLLPEGPDGTWLAGDVRLNRPTGPMEAQVLEALERWGQDIPDQLDGDFALAAWTPSARRLILGRDIMAIRPLCYTMQPGRLFAFASLPRGLHGAGFATTAPDIKAMGRMVIQPYFRGSATGYHDISWLPAGHSLTLTPQGMRLHQSWRIDPTRIGAWRGSDIEAATTLRNLIEDAVTCRLPPHGAVASHLSGGLDSSCISIIAARRLRETKRKLHAFSLLEQAWPAQDILSERFYIDAVLQQEPDIIWNANHLTSLSEGGIIDPDLIIDGPLEAPEEQICAKAASLGASLILSGAGGDECATFSGKSPWRRLPRYKWLSRMKRNLLRQPSLPEHAVLLSPELAEQISEDFDISADNPRLRFCNPLQSPFFGRATRWAIIGARHGVAFSFPLADRKIIEFCLSLPAKLTTDKQGFLRQPFRNAMEGVLPESIRWRPDKLVVFPDYPLILADDKSALLMQLETFYGKPEVEAVLNLKAIATMLQAVPEREEAEAIMRATAATHAPWPPHYRNALFALRALRVAENLLRKNG